MLRVNWDLIFFSAEACSRQALEPRLLNRRGLITYMLAKCPNHQAQGIFPHSACFSSSS